MNEDVERGTGRGEAGQAGQGDGEVDARMIETRMRMMEVVSREDFASLVVEGYYEVVKETLTALMALDGYKTLSYEVLVGYLKEFFPQFSESEVLLVDRLRQLRNRISYMGFSSTPITLRETRGG